jgi:UDP-N-acetyl-D-galactosamine dehydrogenase
VTFKENCPDLRNSRALDLARQLGAAGARVEAIDPWADAAEVARQGVALVPEPQTGCYDAVVLAVAHDAYRNYGAAEVRALGRAGAAVYDVKSAWPREAVDERL